MRDIRKDIQERVDGFVEELFHLETRLGRLQQLEQACTAILAEEETHWPQQEALLTANGQHANGQQLEQGFGNILAEEETGLPQQEPVLSANGQRLEVGFRNISAEEETDLPQQEPVPSATGQQLEEAFGDILAEEETHLPQQEPLPNANGQPQARGRAVWSYSALGRFIFAALNDGDVWSLEDLTKGSIKAAVLKGKSDPKKVMQMVLEGMKQNGKVEMPAPLSWRLSPIGRGSS